MSRKAGNSAKAERDRLRDQMRALGCTVGQIAVEMGRRFNLRPRVAWRHALGWPQWKLAQRYNTAHPGARLADNRVSEFEAWPHGGSPPSLRYLAQLAATFGHGCTPAQLVDAEDLEHLTPADRCLYKIAGQLCGLLCVVTFDLGHPHAANTHARTALHCAEVSGYTPLRAFIRNVQSNNAYWDGRYDEAAQLAEAALPDATSGTELLRLASQQARIHAARHQPGEVSRALALAATAPTERTPDEPGILGFDAGTAALLASEAHCTLGGADDLDVAVDWARIAVDEFSAESQPKAMYIAAARFDLASAHPARGDLDAVREHLAPILRSTGAEYRTVPVIGRAQSLRTLLTQRTDLTSPTMTALRDDLAEFCTHPAPTPPGLEPDPTT
ncbi:MAG: hypothetical protein ACRDQ4_16105 [Pseudonocardiaceae bacterium]